MEARTGKPGVPTVRAVALLVAMLALLMVATVAVAEKADAHQTAGRTIRRFCSDERTRLVVKVNDGSVSSTTYSTNSG